MRTQATSLQNRQTKKWRYALERISREKSLYLIFLPVFLYYLIFCYIPLAGIVLAFKHYVPRLGIWGSPFVGLEHFINFFHSYNFRQVLVNTLRISGASILFSFPAPIILAILLNEVPFMKFKKTIQTISYLPHFISLVVAVGLVLDFTSLNGLINNIIVLFGGERIAFMMEESWFTTIYVTSGIWQQIGWGSIIYLATISGINQELYEAADIDGAGRFGKILHVTLPGIAPTITVLLIMQLGRVMSVGYEKIILMSNELVVSKAEVISSYVYKLGFGTYPDYGYSTAVNLFNMVINLILLTSVNCISRKLNETSLW